MKTILVTGGADLTFNNLTLRLSENSVKLALTLSSDSKVNEVNI